LSWEISFLFSALIIVTGPTVIAPILRNIPLKKDVSAVLKWEGILIDPIGALVAVLVFEFISVGEGQAYTKQALIDFGKIILFGFTFGFTFAHGLAVSIKRNLIPHYLLNVASLSIVLLVFVVSDVFAHESGLLAVVVMGLVLGNINLPNIKELLYFKESLSVLLISILFILLAANVNLEDMQRIYTWQTGVLFAIIVFVIRPLGVLLSTQGSGLKTRERLFIGWVGPRGIVAAGIASLFGSKLVARGEVGAEFITPLVFTVVLGTVLLNATTARPFAKMIGVFLKSSDGILMVGASKVSRVIAQYLLKNNRHVVLIDNNPINIDKAKAQGLEAFTANIYSDNIVDNLELTDVGYLLAMTANPEINQFVVEKFQHQFGENGSFRIADSDELNLAEISEKTGLFSHTDDFVRMLDAVRKNPIIHEMDLQNTNHFLKVLNLAQENPDSIPLFVKYPDGFLNTIPNVLYNKVDLTEGFRFVYLGQLLDQEQG
jgi:NhaP-type Na+/H+ or K+/H+ antiporter